MNKTELVAAIASKANISKKDAEASVRLLLKSLRRGRRFSL